MSIYVPSAVGAFAPLLFRIRQLAILSAKCGQQTIFLRIVMLPEHQTVISAAMVMCVLSLKNAPNNQQLT
jgi:hypothetical protein